MMQAVRFVGVGRPAQIDDVPKPAAGPGQVLIKIGGAGVCHSDLHVMEEDLGFRPPFTLGHENAGWVAALGDGAKSVIASCDGPIRDALERRCRNDARLGRISAGVA
jgi:D-arabinose 1-dehydrogenase-like Zn-dependent alcohol dehydrogenase